VAQAQALGLALGLGVPLSSVEGTLAVFLAGQLSPGAAGPLLVQVLVPAAPESLAALMVRAAAA
jgi:hypothetical protein